MPPWHMLAPIVRLFYRDRMVETGISVMRANVLMVPTLLKISFLLIVTGCVINTDPL